MNKKLSKISDAEMEIMQIVWNTSTPITSNEILKNLPEEKDWKITTVLTLASRLIEKGILASTKKGRTHYYVPALSEAEYRKLETKDFLKKTHGDSIKSFFAALYDNEGITQKDIEELREWLSKR